MKSEKEKTLIPFLRQEEATFAEKPFGPLDAFSLSVASYLQLENTMAFDFDSEYEDNLAFQIHLMDDRRFLGHVLSDIPVGQEGDIFWFNGVAPEFKKTLMESARYEEICVSDIITAGDHDGLNQFAAMCFHLPDGSHFISFRGTDSTIAGWEEDFLMAIMSPIPSQSFALAYVEWIIKKWNVSTLRIGGHSKGGNLAFYSGVHCDSCFQSVIKGVYSFDGPGFSLDRINAFQGELDTSRFYKFVPSESVFGKMFYDFVESRVVKSNEIGLMQHQPFSWQILGDHFVFDVDTTATSKFSEKVFDGWIDALSEEEKEEFLSLCFGVFDFAAEKANTDHIEDIPRVLPVVIPALVSSLKELDIETQKCLVRVLLCLAGEFTSNLLALLPFVEQK